MILTRFLERHATRIERVCVSIGERVEKHIFMFTPSSPYLGRHYLFRRSVLPEKIQRLFPSIYLHYFFRGDDDTELHNHPWRFSLSLILTNGYVEERRTPEGLVRRIFRPGSINIIRASDYHRVELINPNHGAWTLFFTFDRINDAWQFWHPHTGEYTHWKTFVNARSRASVWQQTN